MIRDFTFIDDITESLFRVINKEAIQILILIIYNPHHLQVGRHIKFLI